MDVRTRSREKEMSVRERIGTVNEGAGGVKCDRLPVRGAAYGLRKCVCVWWGAKGIVLCKYFHMK